MPPVIIALAVWKIVTIAVAAVTGTGGAAYGGIKVRNALRDRAALKAFKAGDRAALHTYYVQSGLAKTDGVAEHLVNRFVAERSVVVVQESARTKTASA